MAEIESAHSLPESVQREPAHNLRFTKLTPLVSSESDEYYTSQLLLDAVLKCLGEIDLDPCCNNHISPNVPARQYFTAKQDGLAQPWSGRVFVNPPYTSTVSLWVEKLCTEFESGNVTEAIALVGSQTDTQWFRRLRCYPRCFLSGQLKFSGTENSARFPAVVFHLGSSAGFDRFFDAFQKLGDIFILVEL